MNKFTFISLFSLLLIVIILPVYAWLEPQRMAQAQADLRQEFVSDAAVMYVENCAVCHGAAGMTLYANNCTVCHGVNGEGSELAVPLNTPEVQELDTAELQRIITEGVPGTMMVGWDNALSPAEIASLAAFLQNWDAVTAEGLTLPPPEPIRVDLSNPEEVVALGEQLFATTCAACHGEEGSGGTGPVLHSLQVLTRNTDEQLANTIINGGHRPGSVMPAFGDRLTTPEIEALVSTIRGWEDTAVWVENPRGTAQGGGPPWMRATPDPANPVAPQETGRGRGPRWNR